MSPAHSRSFRILWITWQMVFVLIGLYSESATVHLHPYISDFQYAPQYHPSRNPNCASRWLRRKFYQRQFEHRNHRRFSFEESFVNQDHPWIQIRAVLIRRSKMWKGVGEMTHRQSTQKYRRKIIISMRINNVGKTNTREEFVLVDHVLDPVKMHKIRLHNPYVIKVRQEQLLHLYGLRFQGIVNAEAREEVVNNHQANFTGCNDGLDNPTCGQMLINGEPIAFSQGFCCSCEDAHHGGSFYSAAAKSNYYQRDDRANNVRNRSESSVNLFDNSKAQRQGETEENEEHDRRAELGNVGGRVTSHNISVVNGPLGECAPPLRKHQEEQLRNNSDRQFTRPSEGFPWVENADRVETPSPILKNVFYDPTLRKQKIEAYINAVYEQAMKERANKQATQENNENKNLLAVNLNDSQNRFRESSRQIVEQRISNGRSSVYESIMDDPRNPSTKLIKLKNEQNSRKMRGKENNGGFLELDKCDRTENFSKCRNREKKAMNRFSGTARLENTSYYTPTFLAIHSSRIPEESQFSRWTEKNALPEKESFAITTEFFTSPRLPFSNNTYQSINYGVTLKSTVKSNLAENVFVLSSRIMLSETHLSTKSENGWKQYEIRVPKNISDNVNELRNVSIERKNLSALAIRNGNASSEERKVENANVSTQISAFLAFTRLRNLSSSAGISRLKELSASNVVARPKDKSSTKILELETRSSLLSNEIQRFSNDLGNLYEGRESQRIYNPPVQTSKDVNLKNNYKFRKSCQKLRKSKSAEKFRGDKGSLKRLGKSLSSRELICRHVSPNFKRKRYFQRRLRRHLQTKKNNLGSENDLNEKLKNEDSSRKMQAFSNYYVRPEIAPSKRKISENRGNGSLKKQVILESGYSYKKVQPEESDNPFLFDNEGGKESNVDKRIEDKFVRISNVLKEDATEARIIQETPENSKSVTRNEVAKVDTLKTQNGLREDLFSQKSYKLNEPVTIRSDDIMYEYTAESIGTRQPLTVNESLFAAMKFTTTNNGVITILSPIIQKDEYNESAFLKPGKKLSATIIGPFLSPPIMRKLGYNVSEKVDLNEAKNPIYSNNLTTKQSEFFTQELSLETPGGRNVNDYFEVDSGLLKTLSSNWSGIKEATTFPGAPYKQSKGEQDGANVRSFEFNNNFSRMITGNFVESQSPSIEPVISLCDGVSVIEPEQLSPSNEEGKDSRYPENPFLGNSEGILKNEEFSANSYKSKEREEIAELIDRIVRQYTAYMPIIPSMPSLDEITEAETLPSEEKTTVTQFTTTLATTTRITDVMFRPSILLLETTPPSGLHEEVSLNEIFADEMETTTTSQETIVSKRKFQTGRLDAGLALEGKARRVTSRIEKSEKQRQKTNNCVMCIKITRAEEGTEDHSWYRTTEMQHIIAENRSKVKNQTKQRHRTKVDYFQNAFSGWSSSTTVSLNVAKDVALTQKRSKRSDLIRKSSDRDFPIFYDYEEEDEENRQSKRTALKNGTSLDMIEPTELRSRIEKRLIGELDYPVNRESFQQSCENRDQIQKHNVILQDIMARNIGLCNINERYLNSAAQKKERNMQDSLENLVFSKPQHVRNDAVRKFDEDISSKNRKAISVSFGTLSARPAKIPVSRKDLSRPRNVQERLEIDWRTDENVEKRGFGERAVAEIDKIVVVRKIAVNLSENARTVSASANDLSNRLAEPQEESTTNRILPGCTRSLEDRDKSRATYTIIRGAKLMIANDKGETRDLDIAVKSVDKKISPPFFAAKQQGCENAGKINENLAKIRARRFSAGKEYFRHLRGEVYDTVGKMISKMKKGKSSLASGKTNIERRIAGNEEHADRSLMDRQRSGRRLLSSGKSSYIEDIDDEYYEDDENETDGENGLASDNETIAGRDDLSDLENQHGLRHRVDRDPRKLAETDRSAAGNANAAPTTMSEKKTIAAYNAAMIFDDMQRVSEKAISSNNYKNKRKKVMDKNTDSIKQIDEGLLDIDTVLESTIPASFNNDKILEAPIENEEQSLIKSTANNNILVQKKNSDDDENVLRNSRAYEKIAEEPLLFHEKINVDNLQDGSLYETQSTSVTFHTREILYSSTMTSKNLLNVEKTFHDFPQSSVIKSKDKGNIKISLIGRIQMNGSFNQTPMLISFNAIPDGSSATKPSISKGLLNTIVAVETTAINLPLNDSNATSDISSITERANDKANDSLDAISDGGQEVGKKNANEFAIKSCEKFFDLARRSEEGRKTTRKDSSRIEKRLGKYNTNSRTVKQIFLTDYSMPPIVPSSKMNKTSVGKMTSEQIDEAIDKLDPRSSGNTVRFPDILGSILVNNDSLKNQKAIKESRCQINASSIEANRSNSNTTTLHFVPLMHISIKTLNIDPTNDAKNGTKRYSRDSRNVTSGDCYRMPTIIRKLELPETTSRELQTWSNYRDSNPAGTFQPQVQEMIINNLSAKTIKSTSSTQMQNDELEVVTMTIETLPTQIARNKCNGESINAIRARNMMVIVRFMMKLLKIIMEDEESSCPGIPIGETVIDVTKNVIVNVSSQCRNNIKNQKSADRMTTIISERTKQNFTTIEWQSTITERIPEDWLPLDNSTFKSFIEIPSHPVTTSILLTSPDQVFKDEGLSTLFESSAGRKVHDPALLCTTPFTTPKSFLLYELERKSFHKDASRKNISVGLTGMKQNSNVFFNDSKKNLGVEKSRLDGGQTNRSWPQNQNPSFADRLHFGKQEIASTTNCKKDKIRPGFSQEKYLTKNRSIGLEWSKSTGVANDTIRPKLSRDTNVSRDALLKRIGATRRDRSECSKQARKTGVSDRRATRTKLLNSFARRDSPEDWIGEHRAGTQQLPVDKKLRESRQVPGGTATKEKVLFRRVRGKINRPRDPNLGGGRSDSFKIEGHVAESGPVAKLSTDDALSISGRLNSPERIDSAKKTNAIRFVSDNIGNSKTGEEAVDKHMSVLNKKRDVNEHRDFWKGNRVYRKRQKAPNSTTKKKTKWQKKKKRKKGSQRREYISRTGNQRFKRHLLMASPEPEMAYDVEYATAQIPRYRYNVQKRNAENYGKFARRNTRQRKDGSHMVDGPEVDPVRAQIRGGQDCTDRRHPPNIDAAKYLESAHCLRFSDLWYSVYQLENPIIEHTVYLQVYEKRVLANGSTYWKDLTEDSVVRLGTFNRHHRGSQDTIAFAYKEVKMPEWEEEKEEQVPNLDVVRDRLLVPSSVTSKGSGYPVEGESDEYLVVPASNIHENGNECDKAGVGFAAFAGQPDRCGRVRGTCLKNQPLAYRRHDVEARAAGRPGCYFLSNFASVPSEPIKYSANGSGSREFLALEYHLPHVSAIDIEVKAGYNAAFAGGFFGRISEVHVDGTALDHTVMTVVMTNTGLIPTSYRSKIVDCPDGLPHSWVNATFPKKIIPPQQDQTVSLDLYGKLTINEFYCSVQLLNHVGQPVATRRIKIRKMDRCFCILHCLCVCVGDARGTDCRPVSPELYHAAGFRGPVPEVSREIFSNTTVDVLLFIISLILLLLFIGFLKWLIGLYIPAVGRWGLDSLLKTKGMFEYLERELKCKCVVADQYGAPVHPETRKRTVRICSRKAEFFLNTTFFLIFPFAVCCYRLSKCFQSVRRRYGSNESKISLTSDKSECPRTICVSTYGDSQDSQMEAEDTKYVIDELNKSEELLRSYSRSKVSMLKMTRKTSK